MKKQLRKVVAMAITAVMAVSAISVNALAVDDSNEVVYTYMQDNQEINITQADLDAGHWDKEALGDTAPVIYEDFPMRMTGFVNDFAELSLDIVYLKKIEEIESVSLKITDLSNESVIFDNKIIQQSFYSPVLKIDGQYEVKLTEVVDGEASEYTRIVCVNKIIAEMPEYVTNPTNENNGEILIADVEILRTGQTVNEDGQIVIDPSIATYDKVPANEFKNYCNSLSAEKTYRIFATDGNRQYGGFFSKLNGPAIYDLTIEVHTWEDINTPVPLTLPNITIDEVKSNAEDINIGDGSYRLRDNSKTGGYAAYCVSLPDSYVGENAPNAQFRIKVTGTSQVAMKVWSSLNNNTPVFKRTITSSNNENSAVFNIYTSEYKKSAKWLSFYVMIYFPSATDGYGMINIEPVSGYEDDVTGSIYEAYNGASLYRELDNTEFMMRDAWDIDAFYIDYWGSDYQAYKVELKNRSLADQALLESGTTVKGSSTKILTVWSVSENNNVLVWSANNTYTIPKNVDMAIYCDPAKRFDNAITIQREINSGSVTSEYYQLSYKMLGQ
ncbi:hypothetical protein FMM68_09130 [Lachnospiraceae bacterium MD329]|nr:hypothetical protein [Lachnospiraceae bacterium MD329]